jgi:hypothetical protein
MYMPIAAAQGGSIEIMQYLQQQGIEFVNDAALLTIMLSVADAHSKLAAAQWLRAQGAEWPAILQYSEITWPIEMIPWAKAQGCSAPATELLIDLGT